MTALLNLKQSPEKTLSGVTNNTSTTSNKKSSETTNNGVTNNASTTSNNNKTPKNKASKKRIVTSNLTTTSSTTLEDELLFEYGGIECIDSMGVMIDLTANNDGLAEERRKFRGLLDNFNAAGFSYESLKNLIKDAGSRSNRSKTKYRFCRFMRWINVISGAFTGGVSFCTSVQPGRVGR